MGRHRRKQETTVSKTVRTAVIAGTVTAGAVLTAVPAAAATVTIPGLGDFAVPDMPGLPQKIELPQLGLPQMAPPPGVAALPGMPPPIAKTVGERALEAGKTKVGTPYAWGGSGPNAFDCSGFVQWSYHQAGIDLPRTSFAQAAAGVPISESDLRPGDIVITNGGGHAALYAGDGMIVHASTTGQPVKYAPLDFMSIYAARRVL